MDVNAEIPLILGRPFLATAGAVIDVKKGQLTLRLNNETLTFDINQAMKKPLHEDEDQCYVIDSIRTCTNEIQSEIFIPDRLQRCLEGTHTKEFSVPQVEVKEKEETADQPLAPLVPAGATSARDNKETPPEAGDLDEAERELRILPEPSKMTPPLEEKKVEFKPMPSHLKYVCLDENYKPIITSIFLTGEEEKQLVEVIRKHEKEVGWSTVDIKEIIPKFCMNKVFMGDDLETSVQPQRRFNEDGLQDFQIFKENRITAPAVVSPNWKEPYSETKEELRLEPRI